MKKMNKVLALLAFAGVVTGVSLNAADVSGHPLAVKVEGIFDLAVKNGVTIEDLKNPAEVAQIFGTINTMAWDEIAKQRAAGTSFTRYFTQKEVQCVINGLNHVVTAFEAATEVVWKKSNQLERDAYKDAFILAIDTMVADLKAKITHAADVLGYFTARDKTAYIADTTAQIDALKARVNNVFTVKPHDDALNARPVAVEKEPSMKPRNMMPAVVAADNAAQQGRIRQGLGIVWGATKWTARTAAILAATYGTVLAAQAYGLM